MADHSDQSPEGRERALRAAAQAAFTRAAELEAEVLEVFPDAWDVLDWMRLNPPFAWPAWCLLPMSAFIKLIWNSPIPQFMATAPMMALYKWRFARSVWIIEPNLAGQLATTMPDTWGQEIVQGLPQWCVYVWSPNPDGTGRGLWIHLEYDERADRPLLLLMIDPGPGGSLDHTAGGIEVMGEILAQLDRTTVTEAVTEFRARDPHLAAQVEPLEAHLSVAAYLSGPDANIRHLDRPGLTPARLTRPLYGNETDIWLVGYTDQY